jgi:hypothetical protein
MAIDPIELLHQCEGDAAPAADRRRRARSAVQWTVTLFRRNSGEAIESTTRNLSSDGFHCLVRREFAIGERLTALLHIPAYDPTGREATCTLSCDARVLRLDPTDHDGIYGLACGIEDYRFAHTERLDKPSAPESQRD